VEEVRRVHEQAYAHRLVTGSLSCEEMRKIGFPFPRKLVTIAKGSCDAIGEGARQMVSNLTRGTSLLSFVMRAFEPVSGEQVQAL
jgi:hypothetical protein